MFGDIAGGVRYFGELAWARSANDADDAFATAFPYGNRVDIVEAYAEKNVQTRRRAAVGARRSFPSAVRHL